MMTEFPKSTQETVLLVVVLQSNPHFLAMCRSLAIRYPETLAEKLRSRFMDEPGLVDIPKDYVDWRVVADIFRG